MQINKIILTLLMPFAFLFAQTHHLSLEYQFPAYDSTIEGDYLIRPNGVRLIDSLLFISDSGDDMIKIFKLDGEYISSFGGTGQGPGELRNPLFVWGCKKTNRFYCADNGNQRIAVFTLAGDFIHNIQCHSISISNMISCGTDIIAGAFNHSRNTLFAVYDETGKMKEAFGAPFENSINQKSYKDMYYTDPLFALKKDSLYVMFTYLPGLMHVYDNNYKQCREIYLTDKAMSGPDPKNPGKRITIKGGQLESFYKHNLDDKNVRNGDAFMFRGDLHGMAIEDRIVYCYYPEFFGIKGFDIYNGEEIYYMQFQDMLQGGPLQYFAGKKGNKFIFLRPIEGGISVFTVL